MVATLMNDLETEEDIDVASNWYPLQGSHMIYFIETTEQWVSSTKKKIVRKSAFSLNHGCPFALKTFAGWAIVGPLYMITEQQTVDCNRIAAIEVGSLSSLSSTAK